MRRNTLVLFILGGIVLFAFVSSKTIFPATQPKNDLMLDDDAMREHCKMMPAMAGCESYRTEQQVYTRSTTGLQQAQPSQTYSLQNGDALSLTADIVAQTIGGRTLRMFGYNGQLTGPHLQLKQSSKASVIFTNNLDVETTIHWHGLRLDNAFDGVPNVTQQPVKPGETFHYELSVPDQGIYWYHPHTREDYQQELGLYGTIFVAPRQEDYYAPVNEEHILILDDILLGEDGDVLPYSPDSVDHALMGRFGNTMLINGKTKYTMAVNKGDSLRFHVVNVANTRTFNFTIAGVSLKLVGSDVGSYEHETFVDSFIIGPAERYTVEAYFPKEGTYGIKHVNPQKAYTLGTVVVSTTPTTEDYASSSTVLRDNSYVIEDIDLYRIYFDKPLDATLTLSAAVEDVAGMDHGAMTMDGASGDIEWEDTMDMMNEQMTNHQVEWQLIDAETGKKNMDIAYRWKVGDKIKLRIVNDPKSPHPMQHPIHFHGQRFLVLEENGRKNNNLVWKDTVLVPKGATVDILLDVTNPGDWMAHCHIAEHLHSGMMTQFTVAS